MFSIHTCACRTRLNVQRTLLQTLLHYPQIARVDIVQFKRGRNVPACTVELEWTGSGEPKPLSHQVKISGAKKPAHFHLRYYPQAVGEFYFCVHVRMHV